MTFTVCYWTNGSLNIFWCIKQGKLVPLHNHFRQIKYSIWYMILRVYLIHAAAAAVKLLQSCPTLCHPTDGSPPGSSVPGTLQARTLEWVDTIKQMVTNITPKEFASQCKKCGFDPWVGKILWRRKWQPTPVFLLGKSPWAEEPGCYSPWECPRRGHDLATKQQLYQRGKNSFVHYHKTEFKIVVAKYQACGWGVEKSRF